MKFKLEKLVVAHYTGKKKFSPVSCVYRDESGKEISLKCTHSLGLPTLNEVSCLFISNKGKYYLVDRHGIIDTYNPIDKKDISCPKKLAELDLDISKFSIKESDGLCQIFIKDSYVKELKEAIAIYDEAYFVLKNVDPDDPIAI